MATILKDLKSQPDTATTAEQLDALRRDLNILTQSIAELGQQKKDEVVSEAKMKLHDAGEKATDAAELAQAKAVEFQGLANDFIKTQPATAIGLAAGLGFLIGFLGSRK